MTSDLFEGSVKLSNKWTRCSEPSKTFRSNNVKLKACLIWWPNIEHLNKLDPFHHQLCIKSHIYGKRDWTCPERKWMRVKRKWTRRQAADSSDSETLSSANTDTKTFIAIGLSVSVMKLNNRAEAAGSEVDNTPALRLGFQKVPRLSVSSVPVCAASQGEESICSAVVKRLSHLTKPWNAKWGKHFCLFSLHSPVGNFRLLFQLCQLGERNAESPNILQSLHCQNEGTGLHFPPSAACV